MTNLKLHWAQCILSSNPNWEVLEHTPHCLPGMTHIIRGVLPRPLTFSSSLLACEMESPVFALLQQFCKRSSVREECGF